MEHIREAAPTVGLAAGTVLIVSGAVLRNLAVLALGAVAVAIGVTDAHRQRPMS
jgi:hypothetical protein